MKCLTVRQPWASQVMSGEKDIEYRDWRPMLPLPCTIVVHAAKNPEGLSKAERASLPRGVILGTVEVIDVSLSDDRTCWEWTLANPKPLLVPIPHTGQLGLWNLPAAIAELVTDRCR